MTQLLRSGTPRASAAGGKGWRTKRARRRAAQRQVRHAVRAAGKEVTRDPS